MFDVICQQCMKPINGASSRLVKDSCGHEKCRMCLMLDEESCQQCNNRVEAVNINKHENVIKLEVIENNYPGVITCNGNAKNEATVINQNGTSTAELNSSSPVPNVSTTQPEIKTEKRETKPKTKLVKTEKLNTILSQNDVIPTHITLLTDPMRYKCNICKKQFITKSNINYHIYCTGQSKPFQCIICNKTFVTKSHLNVHEMRHKSVKPFICNICQKAFLTPTKLKRHIILHSTEKPFVCSECGKSFRSNESLKIHISIHRGEKPYECRVCNATFNNASNLNKHLISHSNEKIHMCDQCGKRFKLKWALTVHRKSHLMIKPFECDSCSRSFVNNKDLQRHMLTHLGTKSFKCSICMTGFRRKDNLHRHVKNAHPGRKADPVLCTVKQLLETPSMNQYTKLVENPNAINVITASPACKTKMETPMKPDSRTGTVINGPVKLAFKTPAFKNNYNIHRDCDYDFLSPKIPKSYDLAESVNICQKILSPSSPPTRSIIRKSNEQTSTEICQKILSSAARPLERPLHYETSFEHKKHAIIKNIKFKLPSNYTNLKVNNDSLKDIIPLKPAGSFEAVDVKGNNNNIYAELKPVANATTSVIVNSHHGSDVHWRRRTAENLCTK